MDDIPPRQMLVSQFIFDVPTDVEPELLVVNDEPTIDTVFELGAVDLTEEAPQGPRPEEILALQYEYGNMEDWGKAYELFAEESKALVTEQQYTSAQESNPTNALTQYSFPSVEVEGDRATIERVYTFETSDDEGQDEATQEAVLEDEGWRMLMRDDQLEFYLDAPEETTG